MYISQDSSRISRKVLKKLVLEYPPLPTQNKEGNKTVKVKSIEKRCQSKPQLFICFFFFFLILGRENMWPTFEAQQKNC